MLCAIFLAVLLVATAAADFVDNVPHADYEFIFHNMHDVLVAIHGNRCYFSLVSDHHHETDILLHHQDYLERYVIKLISEASHRVKPSTLSEVRNIFADLLADFRCADKDIYLISLDRFDFQSAVNEGYATSEPHSSTVHPHHHPSTHHPDHHHHHSHSTHHPGQRRD